MTTCKDFKTGIFQFEGIGGTFYTIVRTDSIQIEQGMRAAQHSTMKITWDSNCEYTLTDRTIYKWGENPQKDNSIPSVRNIIYKVEPPNKFFVKTYVEGYPDTTMEIFYKLDTTKYYDDIFELPNFREYKDSKSYGESLFDEIYSMNYYQSNQNPNKYILIFETSYETATQHKEAILDQRIITINKDERITRAACSFNGNPNNEIMIIYKQKNETNKPKIVRAFQFNRETKKIEEIDKSKVECEITLKTKISD